MHTHKHTHAHTHTQVDATRAGIQLVLHAHRHTRTRTHTGNGPTHTDTLVASLICSFTPVSVSCRDRGNLSNAESLSIARHLLSKYQIRTPCAPSPELIRPYTSALPVSWRAGSALLSPLLPPSIPAAPSYSRARLHCHWARRAHRRLVGQGVNGNPSPVYHSTVQWQSEIRSACRKLSSAILRPATLAAAIPCPQMAHPHRHFCPTRCLTLQMVRL